jgi:hypothetical protein
VVSGLSVWGWQCGNSELRGRVIIIHDEEECLKAVSAFPCPASPLQIKVKRTPASLF